MREIVPSFAVEGRAMIGLDQTLRLFYFFQQHLQTADDGRLVLGGVAEVADFESRRGGVFGEPWGSRGPAGASSPGCRRRKCE